MAVLEIKDVRKEYKEAGGILKGVSLSVEKGEVVVILGPSGCGKSTLLRCINGLEAIQGGEILLDGEVISNRKNDMHLIRQRIGMVFQSYDLFPNMTVLKNVMLGPLKAQKRNREEVKAQAEQLLSRVGLIDKKNAYPRQLSGGQKQRVAIAGVVAMEPKCIVFDEPTAMLDPNGRKEVIATAHDLNKKKGVTIILITHYMEEVVDADYVYVMEKGKIVMDGTPRDIFSRVDELKEHRLDVPQATLVADELRSAGVPIPQGILTRKELVDAIMSVANA